MSNVTRLKRKPKLRVVQPDEGERVFGSAAFIARDRNPALPRPSWPLRRTAKGPNDIII